MMPEIFKDTKGRIVGVIVALSLGKYRASVRVSLLAASGKSLILHKRFDQLERARYWVRRNTLAAAADCT